MLRLDDGVDLTLPNIRKIFVADPGYTLFDVDLAGADAQIVAWEADDHDLKQAFRDFAAGKGPKIHCVNSKTIFGARAGADGKTDPYYTRAKMGVHLTNYGGNAFTCAAALEISIKEAEHFQRVWFEKHPAILAWHQRVMNDLQTKRAVYNPFGFRRLFFDRIDKLLPQALAWVPQSTVALVIDTGYNNICRDIPEIEILLQVHDSLVGQCPTRLWPSVKPRLQKALTITIPYPDPLIIPTGLKTSLTSWGEAHDENWN